MLQAARGLELPFNRFFFQQPGSVDVQHAVTAHLNGIVEYRCEYFA